MLAVDTWAQKYIDGGTDVARIYISILSDTQAVTSINQKTVGDGENRGRKTKNA